MRDSTLVRRRIVMALTILSTVVLTACGGRAAGLTEKGTQLFDAQDYAGARDAYQQAVDADPEMEQALYNLGNAEFRLNEGDGADRTLTQAADMADKNDGDDAAAPLADGLDADAWYNVGNVRFAAGNFAGAIDAYKEALRRDPSDVDTKINLELALRNLQQNEENQQNQQTSTPTPTESPSDESQETATPTPSDQGDGDDEGTATPPPSPTPEPPTTGDNQTATPTVTPSPSPAPEQPGTPQPTEAPSSPSQSGNGPEVPASGQLTADEARRILDAAAGNAQSLQQALQGTSPINDDSVDKDW